MNGAFAVCVGMWRETRRAVSRATRLDGMCSPAKETLHITLTNAKSRSPSASLLLGKELQEQPSVWEHCEWHVQQAPVLAVDCVNVYFRVVPVDVSLCQIPLKLHTQFSATSKVSWARWQLLSEAGKHLLEVCKPCRCSQSALAWWDLPITVLEAVSQLKGSFSSS